MSRSVTLVKGKNNMIGISIGGGAPMCPVLYVVQVYCDVHHPCAHLKNIVTCTFLNWVWSHTKTTHIVDLAVLGWKILVGAMVLSQYPLMGLHVHVTFMTNLCELVIMQNVMYICICVCIDFL